MSSTEINDKTRAAVLPPIIGPEIPDETDDSTGYRVLNGALPTWHDAYVANGTVPYDWTSLLFDTFSSSANYGKVDLIEGFNTTNADAPSKFVAYHSKCKGAKPCTLFNDINGKNPIWRGTENVLEEPAFTSTYYLSYVPFLNNSNVVLTRYGAGYKGLYDTNTKSYVNGTHYSGGNSATLDRGLPYVTFAAICGGGGGGALGYVGQCGPSGAGAATLCCLIDWTVIDNITVTFGIGGLGAHTYSGTSLIAPITNTFGQRGEFTRLRVKEKNKSGYTYFYIAGGEGAWHNSTAPGGNAVYYSSSQYATNDFDNIETLTKFTSGTKAGITFLKVVAGADGKTVDGAAGASGNSVSSQTITIGGNQSSNYSITFPGKSGGAGGENQTMSITADTWDPPLNPWDYTERFRQCSINPYHTDEYYGFVGVGGGASLLGTGGPGGSFYGSWEAAYWHSRITTSQAYISGSGFDGAAGAGGGGGIAGMSSAYGSGGCGGDGTMVIKYASYYY